MVGFFKPTDARTSAFKKVVASREALKSQEEFVAKREMQFLRVMGWTAQNDYYCYKNNKDDTKQRPKAVELAITELSEMLIAKKT